MKPGIYVHIPFCEQRCHYCAFTVAVSPDHAWEPYAKRIVREIELSRFRDAPETIFFGGGTPSLIRAELIEAILAALPSDPSGPAAKEVSLEANPGTLQVEKLEKYRDIGINRISLGAQSFLDRDLETAGRLHKVRDIIDDFEALRRCGFSNINIDLIAGLPNQTLPGWRENLDWLGRLRPEHVSIYMLDVEEHSVWGRKSGGVPPGEEDEEHVQFYLEAADRLGSLGYVHYEISNWALPGFECVHNLKYWNGAAYRGFGVSAHSFDGVSRFWNSSSLKDYAEMVDSGTIPVAGREALTREMRLDEAFLLGLRRISGFDIWRVAEDLGIQYSSEWFAAVEEMQRAGWIEFNGNVLKLAPPGWLLANGITEELLWPSLLSTSEATL
jgi:oxygen-independent coproporphyrinogen-3 oxidase